MKKLLVGLPIVLASIGAPATLWAQQAAAKQADNKALGTPMGKPIAATNLGAVKLQSQVDESRKPVGTAKANPSADVDNAAADATTKAAPSGEPQPMSSLTGVGTDYRIGTNDLLDFDVFGVPNMQRTVRVNASGVVALPLIGPVQLAGLTAAQAETLIAGKYAKDYLQDPQISLFIKEFTTQRITIEGAVAKPGIYPVTGQLTLLRALALAGGGAQYALLNEVMLFRGGSTQEVNTQMFDLEKIRSGEISDPMINSDDVIVVKRDPKRTALRDSFFGDLLSTLNPFK